MDFDFTNIYYVKWKKAEKAGNNEYAEGWKELYRQEVMKKLKQPYNYIHDKLRMYSMLNLN